MKKVIGVIVILLLLPLLAWSFYVEVIFLGEAKGKHNKAIMTAEERYTKSSADAEKRKMLLTNAFPRNVMLRPPTYNGD